MKYCLRCNKELKKAEAHYGQHLSCFEEIFKVSGRIEFSSLIRKSSTSDNHNIGQEYQTSPHLTSYFGGNYRKYEAILGVSKYILKLSKPEYPELAPVEYVCNKIAYHCGLSVPIPFTLIDYGEGELAFVSKNFMEKQHVHATLNHLYHYKPLQDPQRYTVEDIAETIYRETGSGADMDMYFRMLLFDALIGNHDRHGRNLALIVTAKSQRLTPIYDNPSSLGLEFGSTLKATFSPRGKIWTKDSHEPEMTEYLKEMDRIVVINKAQQFYNDISIDKIVEYIDESFSLSMQMREALKKLILKRYEDLGGYFESR
ncbi:MAG: HipA domain-containing protein [Pseudomonadota bacterium]